MASRNSLLAMLQSIYNDEYQWSIIKSIAFFALGIRIAKECEGLELLPIKILWENCPPYLDFCKDFNDNEENKAIAENIINSMTVFNDFLDQKEEQSILNEIQPYMMKLKYEFDHWDDAIHGYRETERLKWNDDNLKIINRIKKIAFPSNVSPLVLVHILDLHKDGYIKPHIDAVRFCGDTIAGLSLLTDSVMRLVHDKNKALCVDVLLKRRSLYIMNGTARYDFTHEILPNENSYFKGEKIIKDRRISIMCRNEPSKKKE